MSELPAAVDRDAMEEAMRLLTLAKSQRGRKKLLNQGRSYLVITLGYIQTYGDLLPANDKQRILDDYTRLWKVQGVLEGEMGTRPFVFKLFRKPGSIATSAKFSDEAALLMENAKILSGHAILQRYSDAMMETEIGLASMPGHEGSQPQSPTGSSAQDSQSEMKVISIPDEVVCTGDSDGDTTIMYESAGCNAPNPAFLISLTEIESHLEKSGHLTA